ncbi:hypothetical protein CEP52_003913 [Fusarium oligoseptatum]|uniref:ubiquitinyl hydrolase 1 n=1 Tax=Fusarium oligoseptatum TaxID=2604345 RepID=A0A428U652_9HYPO|nr:hypothetical protein CEP52_003913 [Fusarium oligoseptatum]
MFQPQPTPFASSCFASYGLAPELDFAFPVSAGGGGPGLLYASPPPVQQQQQQQQHQPQPQSHLIHQIPRQLSSSTSPTASSPFSSQASTSNPSPPPNPATRDSRSLRHYQHQQRRFQHRHQHQQQPPHPPQQQQQPYSAPPGIIVPKMEDQGQHDMAAQQAAAKDYQPILEGLKVGNKLSTDILTHEYAKADPVYVDKTITLPQTYSHFRPIQGDGNCGWRAIGFSYFEKLIDSGDQAKIEGEAARLLSMGHMLSTVGGYSYFEDWADEMIGLLRQVAQSINDPTMAHMLVQEKWNDPGSASGMIYYLRLLSATYLKANAATYDAFVNDGIGIPAYCSQFVEIVDREIEHLGVVGLVHTLLKPANLVLEIAYLDRSPGTQVNRYRFPEEANGQDIANIGPIIYLLFRPNHYDILYRSPPVPVAPPISMQVNRVSGFSHNTDITATQTDLGQFATLNFESLAMIPGLNSSPAFGGLGLAPPPPASSVAEPFSPVQQSPWMPSFPETLPVSTPQAAPPPPPTIMASPQPPTPPASLSGSSAMGPSPPMVATSGLGPQTSLMPPPSSGYHIRFSPVQLEYEESKNSFPEPTFHVTTNTFKNSVWNRAHYGNPDFHPEEWSPDDEHTDGRVGGKRKKKDSA